jgi:SAM-dependent methyltransferase
VTRLVKILKTLGLFDLCFSIARRLGLLPIAYATYESAIARQAPDDEGQSEAGGLPVPPARLRALVAGADRQKFLAFGGSMFQLIVDTLRNNGAPVHTLGAVLDFGCGCGRVLRYWHGVSGPRIYGTDYNPRLVEWGQRNLPFARVSANTRSPPLPYESETFDCVYAVSVFTHLSEALQTAWMAELLRVTRPGGVLILTTHGERRLEPLTERQRREFAAGRMVVINGEASGMNLCNAYHPEVFVRSRLATGCAVAEFIPGGTREAITQDLYLMRKSG